MAFPSPTSPPDTQAPPWAGRTLSPMLRQYVQAKEENPDVILMFRMGDFFELFFDDAKVAAELLDLTLTARDKGDNPVPMAGVPHHAVEGYIARLVSQGHSVALCDQIEDPKASKGLVKRAITRLVTPGTVCELDALDPGRTSYLAAVVPVPAALVAATDGQGPQVALAFLDVLAGEMPVTVVAMGQADEELARMGAREVLGEAACLPQLQAALRARGILLRPLQAERTLRARRQASASWSDTVPQDAAVTQALADKLAQAGELLPDQAADVTPEAKEALRTACQEALTWAVHTQRRELGHVGAPRLYQLHQAMVMDEATRQNLELTHTQRERHSKGSLLAHLHACRTPMGARLLRRWLLAPLRSLTTIGRRADVVAALLHDPGRRESLRRELSQVRDLERLAGRVAVGRANPRDVLALGCSLLQLQAVATCVQQLAGAEALVLAQGWQRAPDLRALGQKIVAAVVEQAPTQASDGGVFRSGFDGTLDELMVLTEDAEAWLRAYEAKERTRTKIAGLKLRYNRVFGYNIEISRLHSKNVPADYVRRQTLANAERYVTPELKRFEERALNAKAERKDHEARLFAELVAEVATKLAELKALARLVAQTDVLACLAEVAHKHRYVRPTMVQTPTLTLQAARHPVLETWLPAGERFVANDVVSSADARQLTILTGPNMAGKSTLMRQTALCAVMAQMGGFVPAQAATVGMVDRLFVRVGASDNLNRGQSTFMVEMVETATILRQATRQSLVLLDEIGRGTSTFDGLSIAWAVAEHLHNEVGCRTLFATHYHELVQLTQTLPRAVAMQVTVHEQDGQLVFLRQLKEGAANRSYGIEVARLAALPAPVLQRARQVLADLEQKALARPLTAQSPAASPAPTPEPANEGGLPAPPRRRGQLSLFSGEVGGDAGAWDADGELTAAAACLRRLGSLDLQRTTPMEALLLLQQLQAQAGGAAPGSSASSPAPRRRRRAPARLARLDDPHLLT